MIDEIRKAELRSGLKAYVESITQPDRRAGWIWSTCWKPPVTCWWRLACWRTITATLYTATTEAGFSSTEKTRARKSTSQDEKGRNELWPLSTTFWALPLSAGWSAWRTARAGRFPSPPPALYCMVRPGSRKARHELWPVCWPGAG